jgi:hypothetical protein
MREVAGVQRFAKLFFSLVAFGATVVGAYLGVLALEITWAFWIIVPMAAIIALGIMYVPTAFRLFEQAQKYPGLLRVVTRLTEEKEELERRLALEARQAQSRYTDGLRGGRAEVVGAANAALSNAQLRIEALSLRDGDVYFAASHESGDIPVVGSRFSV